MIWRKPQVPTGQSIMTIKPVMQTSGTYLYHRNVTPLAKVFTHIIFADICREIQDANVGGERVANISGADFLPFKSCER